MTPKYQFAFRVRNTIWFCLLMISATLSGTYLKPYLPATIAARMGSTHGTVLPATIGAGSQFNIVSEFPAKINAVLVSHGLPVKEGEALLRLESAEITSQLATARKRVEIATLRLRDARASDHLERALTAQSERLVAAVRDRSAARERLKAFSLAQAESALAAATSRVTEIRSLIRQGVATSAELDNARVQEQGATRDLNAAREHFSRLKQEDEQAEAQVRLAQVQPATDNTGVAPAEWELEQAGTALALAEERERRLVVTAPGAGTIIELPVHVGESVLAGVPLARIADLSHLMISVPVSAQIARKITIGKRVRVRLPSDPPIRVDSTVESVTITPNSAEHAYLIRVLVPNPDPKLVLAGLEAAVEFEHLEAR